MGRDIIAKIFFESIYGSTYYYVVLSVIRIGCLSYLVGVFVCFSILLVLNVYVTLEMFGLTTYYAQNYASIIGM